MNEFLLFLSILGYSLFWGLRKGSTFCVAFCAPSLFPVISQKESWTEGLMTGIKFNAPRVLLLVIFGGALGFILYKGSTLDSVSSVGGHMFRYGYLVIGTILILLGLYNLSHSLEEREDIKEGVCHPLFKVVRDRKFPFVWGSLFSLVCVGEAAIGFETFLLVGSMSFFFSSPVAAVSIGGLVMFFFGIGLSVPMLLYTSLGAKYSVDRSRIWLNRFRIFSSVLMILFGMIAVISSL